MLGAFVADNRAEILARAQSRVVGRGYPLFDHEQRMHGPSVFLDQLGEALRKAAASEMPDHSEIQKSSHRHGHDLFHHGVTIEQVVHGYGDLCQVITGLAMDQDAAFPAAEFQTLNLCLDEAIAGAVAAFAEEREQATAGEGIERLGILTHEMRNLLNAAIVAFANIKAGIVAPSGSTSAILDRNLMRLNTLIDRSLADVRLDAGLKNTERFPVLAILDEIETRSSLDAQTRGVTLEVSTADPTLVVEADRQILAAAVANLVQNALKFTRPDSHVVVRASATPTRVLLEVEDECGGLPAGVAGVLTRPFVQRGANRTGLGLGLAVCLKAVKTMAGELHIRDLPGKGCVFTIELPRQPTPPSA